MGERLTVREACRRRMPLDGSDAQCLEHALEMTERERDEARRIIGEIQVILNLTHLERQGGGWHGGALEAIAQLLPPEADKWAP